jgi:spore coat protein CotH
MKPGLIFGRWLGKIRPGFFVLAILIPAGALAQTADELFDPTTVHDIQLRMNARDLQSLHLHYVENAFYPADIEWRGVRVGNVAVRSRGEGSRSDIKLGLELQFDRYIAGQRLLGLRGLVLDNLWQDPALLRESLTMALFARLGQPAPRESYARVFINDEYQGLYALVEAVDDQFLTRTFGDPQGYVFEFHWLNEFLGGYPGSRLSTYNMMFEPRTHELESPTSVYAPIERLFYEVNRNTDTTWREDVERYLDVPQLLMHVAIEEFVSELDGLAGYAGMNNFYLYRPSNASRHLFIPWDRDSAFQDVQSSVFMRMDTNEILRRLLTYPELREQYLQMLEACAGAAARDGWLEREVAWRAALIRDAARADLNKSFTDDDFERGIAFLQSFARQRPAIVLDQVRNAR